MKPPFLAASSSSPLLASRASPVVRRWSVDAEGTHVSSDAVLLWGESSPTALHGPPILGWTFPGRIDPRLSRARLGHPSPSVEHGLVTNRPAPFSTVHVPQTASTRSSRHSRRLSRPSGLPGAGRVSTADARRGTTWSDQVAAFVDWKRRESTVGEDWIRRMRWELLRFPRLLARVGAPSAPCHPGKVTLAEIEILRRSLPWEKATLQLHFAALRQFLAWSENPIAARRGAWSLPSGQPTHRRWLSKEQPVQLYRGSEGPGRLLVALEGLNGLRRVEVLRLRAKDVGLGDGCLRVLGKGRNGGKWRTVPIFPAVRSDLEVALVGHGPADRLVPLSRSGADSLLSGAAKAAGLTARGVKVSHHDLRRTFGRLAHAAGMDLVQLKNLLGHTSVEMTVHYIGLDADTMRAGLERFREAIGPLD